MSKTIIIPTQEIVELLQLHNRELFEKHKLRMPEEEEWQALVMAAIEDIIVSKSSYCKHKTTFLVDKLKTLLPWYEEGDEFSDWWYTNIFDPIDIRLLYLINNLVPEISWDVWSVLEYGRDLKLENSGDYRVLEWEKKTKSGEW